MRINAMRKAIRAPIMIPPMPIPAAAPPEILPLFPAFGAEVEVLWPFEEVVLTRAFEAVEAPESEVVVESDEAGVVFTVLFGEVVVDAGGIDGARVEIVLNEVEDLSTPTDIVEVATSTKVLGRYVSPLREDAEYGK
jgi:hypothetical protein